MEGASSIDNEIALINHDPFTCVWLTTQENRTDRVVLEANEDHWNKERGPRLEKVVFHNDLSPQDALSKVCDGEGDIDIVTNVAPKDAQRVKDSEHATLATVDAMRILCGIINRKAEDVPLNDAAMRRALNLAVDKKAVIDDGHAGYAYAMPGLTPPYAGGFPDDRDPYPHDPEKARDLMQQAGWPDGRALRLATPTDQQPIAEMMAQNYRDALGIEVDLIVIPDDELLAAQHALCEQTMDLPFDVLVHAWFDLASDAPPAVMHREFFHSTGAFRAGPAIDELEDLFGHFITRVDGDELTESATKIDRYVHDEALAVFLCAPQHLVAVNKEVNFTGHAATLELAETSVTEEHWSRR